MIKLFIRHLVLQQAQFVVHVQVGDMVQRKVSRIQIAVVYVKVDIFVILVPLIHFYLHVIYQNIIVHVEPVKEEEQSRDTSPFQTERRQFPFLFKLQKHVLHHLFRSHLLLVVYHFGIQRLFQKQL